MNIGRTLAVLVFLSASASVLAQTAIVKVSLSGVGPNVVVMGAGTGTLENNVLRLYGTMIRTEFNENGTMSVWTQDLDTVVDFNQLAGDWDTTNCVDVSGPVYCANNPPSSGTWDTVAGTPFSFTTTENGTTVTWNVTQPESVPVMPAFGLAAIAVGLLVAARRRLLRTVAG